jgi:anti-anti-sigma regulatory factor
MSHESFGGSCASRHVGDVLLVTLGGRLAGEAGAALLDWLPGPRDGAPQVVVNLADVTSIDHAGANALMDARSATAARHGTLALAGPTAPVYNSLRQFGVLGAIEVFADVAGAIDAVSRRQSAAPSEPRRDEVPLASSDDDRIDRGSQGRQAEDPHESPDGRRNIKRVR